MQGMWVQLLVGTELISHMSCSLKKKGHKQQKQYCNKFNKDFKNGPYKKNLLKNRNHRVLKDGGQPFLVESVLVI